MKKKLCLLFVCLFLLAGLTACGGDYKLTSFNNITTTELKDGINKNIKALNYNLTIPNFAKEAYELDGKKLDKYISKINDHLFINITSLGNESITINLDKRNINPVDLQVKNDEFVYTAFATIKTIDPTINTSDLVTNLGMLTSDSGSTIVNGYQYGFYSGDYLTSIIIFK